jgi:perosamine synthetase
MNIPLSNPDITSLERNYVDSVLRKPILSLGPMLSRFESEFAKYIGSEYAIAVNSGTSGLHLSMKVLNLHDRDTIITTPFSFIASANCILFERARPIFVDIDPITLNIDPEKIEKCLSKLAYSNQSMPKAVLPVHVFGLPCNMEKIMAIAKKYELEIIEDACEAIGSEFNGKKVGTFGKMGVFAFYPNKQITTGEGGMIVTNNELVAKQCKSLRNQGRGENGMWYPHERLGYNYRLSDINCALGLAQLERLDEILKRRATVAEIYNEKLKNLDEIHTPCVSDKVTMSWFVYVIRLADQYTRNDRDTILAGLRAAGIGCSNYFVPIHLQPFYRKMFGYRIGDFPITEHISERTIALPFYNNLTERQIKVIVDKLQDLLKNIEVYALDAEYTPESIIHT